MADFLNLPSKEGQDSQNQYLAQIAQYLGVTAGNLQDAINMANKANSDAAAKIADIENRFQQLTTSQQQDAEVVSARQSTVKSKTFASLDARLEEDEQDLKTHKAETATQLNSNKIYVDTIKDNLNDRIDNIIATPTTVSEQEIIDARQGKASLGANLTAIKDELTQHKLDYVELESIVKHGFYNDKMFYSTLNGNLKDEIANKDGIFTRATTRVHPIYDYDLAVNEPLYMPIGRSKDAIEYNVLMNKKVMAVTNDGVLWGCMAGSLDNKKILQKSLDNGTTWVDVYTFLQEIQDIHITPNNTILVSISDTGSEADARTCYGKIFRSTDGVNFTKVYDIPAGQIVYWGFSSYGNYVLACSYGGRTSPNNARYIFRSEDDGINWTIAKDFGETFGGHVHRVAFDPYYPGHSYAFTGDLAQFCTVWKSEDYGVTWTLKLSNDQKYRFVGISFDENYVYFGGDGYHDVGGGVYHFGIYKWDRSLETITLMTVVTGPIYEMWKDQDGQIFAFGLNDQIDKTDNIAYIYALKNGRWEVIKEFETSQVPSAGFGKVIHYKNKIYAICTSLLITGDYVATLVINSESLRNKAIRLNSGEKIAWTLEKELPIEFTIFIAIRFPVVSTLTALNYIFTLNSNSTDMITLTVGSTRQISFGKRMSGQTNQSCTISASGDIANGDTVVVCLKQNSALKMEGFVRLNNGKYRRLPPINTTFFPSGLKNLQTGYISAGYEPNVDISNLIIYDKYMIDSECEKVINEIVKNIN